MSKSKDVLHPLYHLINSKSRFPNKRALNVNGVVKTYSEIFEESKKRAKSLQGLGVRPFDKVIVMSDDDIEVIKTYFATWMIKSTPVPFNMHLKKETLNLQKKDLDTSFVLDDDLIDKLKSKELTSKEKIEDDFQNLCELSMVLFTSGTTGVSKAVPVSGKALFLNSLETAKFIKMNNSDNLFINTPQYTTSSLVHMLSAFSVGATLTIDRGILLADNLITKLDSYECTGFGGVPIHFTRFLQSLEKSKTRPRTLRFAFNSGDHLPTGLVKQILQSVPELKLYCAYGLTEVAGRLCILDAHEVSKKMGAVGRPLPGMEINILDESLKEVEAGEVGEIYVRGEWLMSGYLNVGNSSSLNVEWGFKTGDFGYFDQEGCLFLQGRKDDIVKISGEKVSIRTVKDIAYEIPEIEICHCVKTVDERLGDTLSFFYKLKKGSSIEVKAIKRYLRKKLPSNWVPLKYSERDEFELTQSGKVSRVQFQNI